LTLENVNNDTQSHPRIYQIIGSFWSLFRCGFLIIISIIIRYKSIIRWSFSIRHHIAYQNKMSQNKKKKRNNSIYTTKSQVLIDLFFFCITCLFFHHYKLSGNKWKNDRIETKKRINMRKGAHSPLFFFFINKIKL